MDAKVVEGLIALTVCKLGAFKPCCGEFLGTVAQVYTTKDPQLKHVLWCEVGLEFRCKISAGAGSEFVRISVLHFIVYHDAFCHVYEW